ncbi:MAG TPA: hypothetical protein VEI97_19915 [bacterium]|nr:hypothetical protein [bacterium]
MSRLFPQTLLLAGAFLLAGTPPAFAQFGEDTNEDMAAPIIGGDSTTTGLTGLVTNPEAYTIGPERAVVGVNFIDQDGGTAWVPTLLIGLEDRFEFGAWGSFGDDEDSAYGASVKWKLFDENTGTNLPIEETPGNDRQGFPSMATWYGFTSADDFTRHRFGLSFSWTFVEAAEEESEEGSGLNNTAFTAGVIYDLIDADSNAPVTLDENDFDWYVGANFVPGPSWSVVLEYEDDDDTFQSDGFAGAVRYHLTPTDDEADEEDDVTWVLQAGVQNTEDLLIGAQANF